MNLEDGVFCSIDVETTGLNVKTDEMIAFASIPMRGGRIIVHDAYYTLIRSEKYRIESMKYHGISERDLEKTPVFGEIAREILNRMNGVLVGHTVEFDLGFLRKHFKKAGIKLKKDIVDIVSIVEVAGGKGRAPRT